MVGDPKGWQTSCSALEAVRSGTRSRGARTVVVVVGSTLELTEERAGAISRIAAIDKRWVVIKARRLPLHSLWESNAD